MGKKSKKKGIEKAHRSSAYPILEISHSISDPLFAAAFHPSANIFATGTAKGYLRLMKYDANKLENAIVQQKEPVSSGAEEELPPWTSIGVYGEEVDLDDVINDDVQVCWKANQHKKSCRDIKFDYEGKHIYTAGHDGILKKTDVETGKAIGETSIEEGSSAITRILTVPNKNFLVVGDEGGNITCYDTKSMKKIYHIAKVHDDTVNCINSCIPKSDYKFVSVGSMTVANWDIRKEKVLHRSEQQDDELFSSCWADQETQKTLLGGMAGGIVTLWKPDLNEFEDQISRININKNESVQSVISAMDSASRFAYAGLSDGKAVKLDVENGQVIDFRNHSNDGTDDVDGLDLDYEYRLVTFGMDKLKIWTNKYDDPDSSEEENLDSDSDSEFNNTGSDEESENASASDNEEEVQKDKKRALETDKKTKSKNKKAKKNGNPSIRRFEGL